MPARATRSRPVPSATATAVTASLMAASRPLLTVSRKPRPIMLMPTEYTECILYVERGCWGLMGSTGLARSGRGQERVEIA